MTTLTFQDVRDAAPVLSLIVAFISAIVAYSARMIAQNALRLNLQIYQDRQSNFTVALNKAAAHNHEGARYLLFDVDIHNHSDMKNTFGCQLELTYRHPNGLTRLVTIDHDPAHLTSASKGDLKGFDKKPRLEEKDTKRAWLCFIEPVNTPDGYHNHKYELVITDNHQASVRRDVYLLNQL